MTVLPASSAVKIADPACKPVKVYTAIAADDEATTNEVSII
ncbi:hypothetical protein [Dietzia sp. CW19]|nr:hypothetical protein [Dietzia sp. CW19]